MHIVYLDQNKWIELARAAKFPYEYAKERATLEQLVAEVREKRLAVPLTATNIYETYKIRNVKRRRDLALIQASLSRGLVLCGRHRRLEAEVTDVARRICRLPPKVRAQYWFLSEVFHEATADIGDPRLQGAITKEAVQFIREQPSHALYDYLMSATDSTRMAAVRMFSDGSEDLRKRVEDRRARLANESPDMRRRAYSATLLIDEMDAIQAIFKEAEVPWKSIADLGQANAHALIDDVPIYHVEREIVLRIEAQRRPIGENDFRDMACFCAAVPYADAIVAENHFTSLARQARLAEKYDTRLFTRLSALQEWLQVSPRA